MGISQERCLKSRGSGRDAGQAYVKPPLLLQHDEFTLSLLLLQCDSICLQQIPILSFVQKSKEYPGPPTPSFVTPRR